MHYQGQGAGAPLQDTPPDLQQPIVNVALAVDDQGEIQSERFSKFLNECRNPQAENERLQRLINACMNEAKSEEVYCAYRDIGIAIEKRLSSRR